MVSGTGLLAVIGSAGLVAAVVGVVIGGAVVAGGRRLGLLRLGWCVIGARLLIWRIAGVRLAVPLRGLAAVYRVLFIVCLLYTSVRGSVQVPGSGQPIVLMSDHQTVGGYAKIATVIGCDVSLLAQARPGDAVRFVPITVQEAEDVYKRQP